MPLLRASRMRWIWGLELALGLELYACAVLALHARGLRATPLEASPSLVLPALVIPPVFYVLVGLVVVRRLSMLPLLSTAAAMCGLHALLVMATGALFMIPDLVHYGAAVGFALWGSPAVTLLQLTATPLVFARLKPLLLARVARAEVRAGAAPRPSKAPAIQGATPPLGGPNPDSAEAARAAVAQQRERAAAAQAQTRPTAPKAAVAASVIAPSAAPTSPGVRPSAPSATPVAPSSSSAVVPSPTFVKPSAATPPAPPASVAVTGPPPTDSTTADSKPSAPPAKPAIDWTQPMIRVPFVRIADQLPVEMFARGGDGFKDTLRPGVSLLVRRDLLMPHLGEGLAPVKWEVVADQFPMDELALSHDEIAARLPDGSLLLPLDEVIAQIPPALLVLQTAAADVRDIEEFPEPFQPGAPARPEATDADPDADHAPEFELEPSASAGAEPTTTPEAVTTGAELLPEPESIPELEPFTSAALGNAAATNGAAATVEPEAADPRVDMAASSSKSDCARRVAAALTPLLSGLELRQHAAAGTTLVTLVAPTLSEDAVVRTATRIMPFLADARLHEPVSQVTLTAEDAAMVLTPFRSSEAGAVLLTAVASRASLAWLERLSRTAALEAERGNGHGKHAGPANELAGIELRPATVPAGMRELADSLTAFGPVSPTLLRDHAGALNACLFLPRSFDAQRVARFAHDLYVALEEAELGGISSVVLKFGVHCLTLRVIDAIPPSVTLLVGVGRVDRPGLARIELDRAATRLRALVGS